MIAEVRKAIHAQSTRGSFTVKGGIGQIGGLYTSNSFTTHTVVLTKEETSNLFIECDQLWMELRDFTKFQVMTYLINKLLKEKQMYKFDGTLYKIADGHAYFQDPDFGWSPSLFSAEEVEKHFEKVS